MKGAAPRRQGAGGYPSAQCLRVGVLSLVLPGGPGVSITFSLTELQELALAQVKRSPCPRGLQGTPLLLQGAPSVPLSGPLAYPLGLLQPVHHAPIHVLQLFLQAGTWATDIRGVLHPTEGPQRTRDLVLPLQGGSIRLLL